MIETLAYGYSSESTQRELFYLPLPFVTWISLIYRTFYWHKLVQKSWDFLKFLLGQAYRASPRSHGNLAKIRQEKLRYKAKEITASGISKLASIYLSF